LNNLRRGGEVQHYTPIPSFREGRPGKLAAFMEDVLQLRWGRDGGDLRTAIGTTFQTSEDKINGGMEGRASNRALDR